MHATVGLKPWNLSSVTAIQKYVSIPDFNLHSWVSEYAVSVTYGVA